jgi:hypothetical protein
MEKSASTFRLRSVGHVFLFLTALNLFPLQLTGEGGSLKSSGWTIAADQNAARLTISHDSLGIVMSDVTLNSVSGAQIRPIRSWTEVIAESGRLTVTTENPSTTWVFEPGKEMLVISATESDLCITAKARTGTDRIVANLLDPEGVPVDWCGTDEITVSWKGKDTHNPSNLSSRNPEVMTFSLGQVSSSNIHSLFDRNSDIAIDFPSDTRMKRNTNDQGSLNLVIDVPGSTRIKIIPDYYTKTLGLPFYSRLDDSVFHSAPQIWGSWTAYYHEVKESDITMNADWIADNLKQYGLNYVQLDDGYDRGREEGHYWIENWNRNNFPHGPEWLTGYIKSKGLKPGLWLVPNSYAGSFKQHPDWYLYTKDGRVVNDYSTPALDQTNPAVNEWLTKLFTTLKGWGFEYFKFDGEFSLPSYVPDLDTSKIFNPKQNQLTVYRDRLKLIRNIIGPGTFVEGCVAGTPLNGIGYFNSCFNGADMYNSWKGSYAVFSSINANAFLNHIAMYVMPGEGIDVSPLMTPDEARQKMAPRTIQVALTREAPFTGFGTTDAEARTLVSIISLTGVAYPLTSILPRLPEDRVVLLKKTMPTLPILPVDLFSRGSDITWDKFKHTTPEAYIHNYPELIDLKVNAGYESFDVVAFTNWRGESSYKSISLKDKLGIDQAAGYVVFDFWNKKLSGLCTDRIDVEVEPHDTKVLLVHPDLGHPQLVGISRHISGVYSLSDIDWENNSLTLKGKSETLKGEAYVLYVYVPDGLSVARIKASSSENSVVETASELEDNLLRVNIGGSNGSVSWQVQFANISR